MTYKLQCFTTLVLVAAAVVARTATPSEDVLVARDSCAAVASSVVSAATYATSMAALRQRAKAAYLELARAPGARLLPLQKMEGPIDIVLDTHGGQILDQLRGGMPANSPQQVIHGIGYAMAFTSATCMAVVFTKGP